MEQSCDFVTLGVLRAFFFFLKAEDSSWIDRKAKAFHSSSPDTYILHSFPFWRQLLAAESWLQVASQASLAE